MVFYQAVENLRFPAIVLPNALLVACMSDEIPPPPRFPLLGQPGRGGFKSPSLKSIPSPKENSVNGYFKPSLC
jgi:hypothetical protein